MKEFEIDEREGEMKKWMITQEIECKVTVLIDADTSEEAKKKLAETGLLSRNWKSFCYDIKKERIVQVKRFL